MKTLTESIINELKLSDASTGNKLNRRKLKDIGVGNTIYIVDFDCKHIMQGIIEGIKQNGSFFRFEIKCKDEFNCITINDLNHYIFYFGDIRTKALVSDIKVLYEIVPKTKTFKMK